MSESPETRVSLLLRLKDSRDHEAWNRFVAIYAPVVQRFSAQYPRMSFHTIVGDLRGAASAP